MKALADLYSTFMRITLAIQLQYRAELAIWLLGLVIQPVIYMVVWLTVAHAQGGQVGNYTSGQFAAYFIVMMMVNHLTFTWIMFEFEFRVRNGSFSPLLLQPVHPIHRDIADNISYKLLTMTLTTPICALLIWAFSPRFNTEPWMLAYFIPALVLAGFMRFFFEWCLALAAFWTTRVTALNQIYFAAQLFLAGRMAPLEMMPQWLQTAAAVSPFRWMLAFPVELLLGRLNQQQAFEGLMHQSFWLVLSFGLLHLVWRRAVRNYSAVGA
jgi:ABC-2 type transport system permease protein